ncbi:energy transducer TonB [Acidocella aminolytica]|uniref:TonB C-terminal domain-containing protein n=1 Tax=Acidocella aminolytica 101 = DSM 11237 TaxID=1120923 RepID=A0A0D6PMZ7_9PROT|nr:energy transducer TonB [Acidocella aminolytica]GAN82169.1 hypothetical protein Aam_170_013 [Acidocella aminolytica 101 = DSM 11237]GBQ43275.1 hypothetical protein AA11237_3234 [Acidocella aminolytica 101 = DSM 11237]SHF55706.1 protein TonB [Acidocella aminolytica 101 = DSM 11237]
MTGPAVSFSAAQLAGSPRMFLRATVADRLVPDWRRQQHWPWRPAWWAGVAHLALVGGVFLAGTIHLPHPPPEQVVINIVPETTAPLVHPPAPKQAESQPPLPLPPPPSPLPAAPLPLPPPMPQAAPRQMAVQARETSSQAVEVLHPAVPFADNRAPDYPQAAIAAGERGVVRFKLYLGADGRVRRFQLTQSSGYADLDASVRAAALGWRYHPATRGKVAVPFVVTFHVEFVPH